MVLITIWLIRWFSIQVILINIQWVSVNYPTCIAFCPFEKIPGSQVGISPGHWLTFLWAFSSYHVILWQLQRKFVLQKLKNTLGELHLHFHQSDPSRPHYIDRPQGSSSTFDATSPQKIYWDQSSFVCLSISVLLFWLLCY